MSEEMNNMFEEEETMTVTLTYDDGTEDECFVLDIFTIEELGDQEYIALLPVSAAESDEEESEIFIYRYSEGEGDDIDLEAIEDEDEMKVVEIGFQALLEQDDEE